VTVILNIEEKTMMNILVTGGAGFIGSNFVYYMLDKYPNYRIVCMDALTYAGNLQTLEEALKNPNFRFVKGDITDREAVFSLFNLSSQVAEQSNQLSTGITKLIVETVERKKASMLLFLCPKLLKN